MADEVNVLDWYMDIPVVTRTYLTAVVGLTALSALHVISPFALYFNADLIAQGEVRTARRGPPRGGTGWL